MAWLQLSVKTGQANAEALAAFLEELGAVTVSLSDAGDEPVLEPKPGEMPLWANVTAHALFNEGTEQASLRDVVAATYPDCADTIVFAELEDREWLNEWKRDTSPKQYGQRLWVYPWEEQPEDDNSVAVYLEPGLAFGTGDHPTTAMCLRWLDANPPAGGKVLDYGCGSGLLAIAAVKLGANRADCVDIDPQALIATNQNALQNGIADKICSFEPAKLADTGFEIVLANILSGILVDLSSTLTGLMSPGGQLVLTGILAEQAQTVIDAYAGSVKLSVAAEEDGWVMLAGRNR